MNTIIRYLTGGALAAAALGSALPQTTRELSLNDKKAQSPQETIFRSDPCQIAREDPEVANGKPVSHRYDANPPIAVLGAGLLIVTNLWIALYLGWRIWTTVQRGV